MNTIVALVSIFLICFGVCLFWRNQAVYKERMRMLGRAKPGSPDFYERMNEFHSTTYNRMLLRWWKPVKHFYKEFL